MNAVQKNHQFPKPQHHTARQKPEWLIWLCPDTGERYHAGVAFYDENFGEHRMILDGPRTVFYLRPKSVDGERVSYGVHAVIEKGGSFSHRVEVGSGYSDEDTNGQIFMKIGRYMPQRLVLIGDEE